MHPCVAAMPVAVIVGSVDGNRPWKGCVYMCVYVYVFVYVYNICVCVCVCVLPYWPYPVRKIRLAAFPQREGGMNTFSENGNDFVGSLLHEGEDWRRTLVGVSQNQNGASTDTCVCVFMHMCLCKQVR